MTTVIKYLPVKREKRGAGMSLPEAMWQDIREHLHLSPEISNTLEGAKERVGDGWQYLKVTIEEVEEPKPFSGM